MKLNITRDLPIVLLGFLIQFCCCNGYVRKQRQSHQSPMCLPGYYLSDNWCYPIKQLAICPEDYELRGDMCYPKTLKPCPFETATVPYITSTMPPTPICPNGYQLNGDVCYPQFSQPCSTTTTPAAPIFPRCPEGTELRGNECYMLLPPTTTTTSTSTTNTTTTSTTTTTTPLPPPAIIKCPTGSALIKGKCRKILCPSGEYRNGKCLQAMCPEGTVWRGHSCQEPGFITTVLEIDNVFINEAHENPGKVFKVNNNNISYHIEEEVTSSYQIETTTTPMPIVRTTTRRPTTTNRPAEIMSKGCCTVFTPRTCKKYGKKWICFNNRLNRCNENICKYPNMYIKTPKVVYEPPILIMPPNPPLETCPVANCDAREISDCSGCPEGRRERCSSYCYRYICPQGDCGFIDHKEFCQTYPGEVGCTKRDGCIWGWCAGN